MTRNLIDKMIYTTLFAALICLVGGFFSHHAKDGVALFSGAIWGALNLFFLKVLLQRLILPTYKKNFLFVLLILIKWPLLYLGGYYLLKNTYLSSMYLLAGFSILFVVIFIFGLIHLCLVKSHEQ